MQRSRRLYKNDLASLSRGMLFFVLALVTTAHAGGLPKKIEFTLRLPLKTLKELERAATATTPEVVPVTEKWKVDCKASDCQIGPFDFIPGMSFTFPYSREQVKALAQGIITTLRGIEAGEEVTAIDRRKGSTIKALVTRNEINFTFSIKLPPPKAQATAQGQADKPVDPHETHEVSAREHDYVQGILATFFLALAQTIKGH